MSQVTIYDSFNRTGSIDGSLPDEFPSHLIPSGDYGPLFGGLSYLGDWIASDSLIADGSKLITSTISSGTFGNFLNPAIQFLLLDPSVFDAALHVYSNTPPGSEDLNSILFELIGSQTGTTVMPSTDFYTGVNYTVDPVPNDGISQAFLLGNPAGFGYIKGGIDTSNLTMNESGLSGTLSTQGIFFAKFGAAFRYLNKRVGAPWSYSGTTLQQEVYMDASYIQPTPGAPDGWNLPGPFPVEELEGPEYTVHRLFEGHYAWLGLSSVVTAHDSWENSLSYEYSASNDTVFLDLPGTDPSPTVTDTEGLALFQDDLYFSGSALSIPETPSATIMAYDGFAGGMQCGGWVGGNWLYGSDSRIRVDDFTYRFSPLTGGSGWYVGIPDRTGGGLPYKDFVIFALMTTIYTK